MLASPSTMSCSDQTPSQVANPNAFIMASLSDIVPSRNYPSQGPVAILWDIENCCVPSDVNPEDVAGNIRMALRVHPKIQGAVNLFSAYGDFNAFPRRVREGCQRTGVKLVDVPNGRKDAADKAILVDMFLFALENPPPSSIMLISGDVDFAPALHILGQRGYTVILVVPNGVGVSSALCSAGRFISDWPSVARGEGFVPPTKHLMGAQGGSDNGSGFSMSEKSPQGAKSSVSKAASGQADKSRKGMVPSPKSQPPSDTSSEDATDFVASSKSKEDVLAVSSCALHQSPQGPKSCLSKAAAAPAGKPTKAVIPQRSSTTSKAQSSSDTFSKDDCKDADSVVLSKSRVDAVAFDGSTSQKSPHGSKSPVAKAVAAQAGKPIKAIRPRKSSTTSKAQSAKKPSGSHTAREPGQDSDMVQIPLEVGQVKATEGVTLGTPNKFQVSPAVKVMKTVTPDDGESHPVMKKSRKSGKTCGRIVKQAQPKAAKISALDRGKTVTRLPRKTIIPRKAIIARKAIVTKKGIVPKKSSNTSNPQSSDTSSKDDRDKADINVLRKSRDDVVAIVGSPQQKSPRKSRVSKSVVSQAGKPTKDIVPQKSSTTSTTQSAKKPRGNNKFDASPGVMKAFPLDNGETHTTTNNAKKSRRRRAKGKSARKVETGENLQ